MRKIIEYLSKKFDKIQLINEEIKKIQKKGKKGSKNIRKKKK